MASQKADYNRLLGQVIVELPGASQAGIKQAMFPIFKEFFDFSLVWQETISITTVEAQTDYPLVSDQPGEFCQLIGVTDGNRNPRPCFLPGDLSTLVLRDSPNTGEVLTVVVAKTVGSPIDKNAFPEIPDWLLAKWGDGIFEGVLGRLQLQPNKPYTDNTMAMFHLKRFRSAMQQARTAALHLNTYGTNAWRFPRGFSTSTQRSGVGTTGTSFNS
jgi:hypothetical protein